MQEAPEPVEVADDGRPIEAELAADGGQRLGRGLLAQDGGGDVARQDLGAGEDQDRDGEEREQAEAQPSAR